MVSDQASLRTEDRHDDIEGEGCVSNQGPWRVSTKNGLDSGEPLEGDDVTQAAMKTNEVGRDGGGDDERTC